MHLKFKWENYEKFAEGNQCLETQRRFILKNNKPSTFEDLIKEWHKKIGIAGPRVLYKRNYKPLGFIKSSKSLYYNL